MRLQRSSPHATLYQINARVWLRSVRSRAGKALTLGEVPEGEIERLSAWGIDWLYLLGVWQTGELGLQIARSLANQTREYHQVLPDLKEEDICGSCFAITGYRVNRELGDESDLSRLRRRLNERGIGLLLDFIPNHTARDHPWVVQHPEYYIQGEVGDLARSPQNYGRNAGDGRVFAFGRDPYFPGWSDTFQLNYASPDLQAAMRDELLRVADRCDGVRCDMAMLVLPEVFERTWGRRPEPFWPEAIAAVRRQHPDFLFLAEVYWDLEAALLEQGFDYAYDKGLLDRLRSLQAREVRGHLQARLAYRDRLARFLENHDEARAAAVFPESAHRCAALLTYLSPGLRFFHEGQFEGHRLRLPVQLCRWPDEPRDDRLHEFYMRLLSLLKDPLLREGSWQLLEPSPLLADDPTWENFIAFAWMRPRGGALLVMVNFSPQPARCRLQMPLLEGISGALVFTVVWSAESLGEPSYRVTDGALQVTLPPWGYLLLQGEPG